MRAAWCGRQCHLGAAWCVEIVVKSPRQIGDSVVWGAAWCVEIVVKPPQQIGDSSAMGAAWCGRRCNAGGRVVCGSEVEAIGELQRLVEEVDPDVVCGFDIQRGSIGYILDRCAHIRCKIAVIIVVFAAAVIVTSCPRSASPAVAAACKGL